MTRNEAFQAANEALYAQAARFQDNQEHYIMRINNAIREASEDGEFSCCETFYGLEKCALAELTRHYQKLGYLVHASPSPFRTHVIFEITWQAASTHAKLRYFARKIVGILWHG